MRSDKEEPMKKFRCCGGVIASFLKISPIFEIFGNFAFFTRFWLFLNFFILDSRMVYICASSVAVAMSIAKCAPSRTFSFSSTVSSFRTTFVPESRSKHILKAVYMRFSLKINSFEIAFRNDAGDRRVYILRVLSMI